MASYAWHALANAPMRRRGGVGVAGAQATSAFYNQNR